MRKLHFFSTLVALVFASTQLWATAADANGKLPGVFTINSNCDKVYFSQGNLQYNSYTQTWQFASEQYEYIGNTEGNTNINTEGKNNGTGIADLFGWVGASSSWTGLKQYGLTSSTATGAVDGYGNVGNEELKSDWGNTMGSGWRMPTGTHWAYIFNSRTGGNASTVNGTSDCRYAMATINTDGISVKGIIIFPDGGVFAASEFTNVGNPNDKNNFSTTCTTAQWTELEKKGCVFLPAAGYRNGTSVTNNYGYYWTTNSGAIVSSSLSNNFTSWSFYVGTTCNRNYGCSVRLVQDMPDDEEDTFRTPAFVAKPPKARENLVYTGSSYALVDAATGATYGGVYYRLGTSGDWMYGTNNINATDAGTYTVQWYIRATGCYLSSEVKSIEVTIAQADYTPSGSYSISGNNLSYTGSSQALVSVTGSVTNGTIWYKLGDGEWTTDIPTAKNAGNYSVSYKVVPTNPNYKEYVPTLPASPIAVTIAQADLVVDLPEATSTIPYDGTEKTLLNIGAVVGGTVYYSNSSEGPWNTTPRTATDPDDYNVYYKIVPDDTDNYNTIGPNQVVVTISDPYVWVADNENPTSKLEAHLNEEHFDLRVKRIIWADDEYNTICLPFALDASALASSQLAGYNRLKAFRGAQVSGSGASTNIDIFVEDATAIEAGVPYLISYPSAHPDIKNPVFEDITVTTTTPGSVSADGVTFQGMFAQVHIDQHSDGNKKDYLFLGENSQLYWPLTSENGNESVKMRGFRAYFIIDRDDIPALVAPRGTHARFVNAPKQPTAIENTELNTQAQKLLENGQLIILKNGIKYNAQGQVLK